MSFEKEENSSFKNELDPDELSKNMDFGTAVDLTTDEPMAIPQESADDASNGVLDPIVGNDNVTPDLSFDFDEIKQIVDTHFANVKKLVRYNKEKDANVLALSKQMQIYRDGVEATLFKRLALELIPYREDCKKSMRNYSEKELSQKDAEKYLEYLQQDYEDLLGSLAIEKSGDTYTYNGKSIDATLPKAVYHEVTNFEEVSVPDIDIRTTRDLIEYFTACENKLSKDIKNNTVLDSLMGDYITNGAIYEAGLYQIVLYPTVRKMVKFYEELVIHVKASCAELDEKNGTTIYLRELAYAIEHLDKILEMCNVYVSPDFSDVYDPKKHRMLKTIPTDNAELNATVAKRYTDCYIMDDKVIYPAKVDLYKAN